MHYFFNWEIRIITFKMTQLFFAWVKTPKKEFVCTLRYNFWGFSWDEHCLKNRTWLLSLRAILHNAPIIFMYRFWYTNTPMPAWSSSIPRKSIYACVCVCVCACIFFHLMLDEWRASIIMIIRHTTSYK